jgi:phosphoenolpyruvate synthase/pyruvate phosphate dikinase
VVGEHDIVDAIRRVWASPFTERAFAWRQEHMRDPEYVFPSVLIQRAFPSEKSGVMVTKDVQGGREGWLTIAVNEGVGGVVDGQAAESLKVNRRSGEVVYLSQASAPTRRELDPRGGIRTVPASGRESVLTRAEIDRLVKISRDVESTMDLEDEDGNPAAADIEFAFRGNHLALLQVRPLVENKSAARNRSLAAIDQRATARPGGYKVPLDQVPGGGGGREVARR